MSSTHYILYMTYALQLTIPNLSMCHFQLELIDRNKGVYMIYKNIAFGGKFLHNTSKDFKYIFKESFV